MRQSELAIAWLHRRRSCIKTLVILSALLYWFGRGGTFEGSLSWTHQFAGHIASALAAGAASWFLIARQSNLKLRAPHWSISLLAAAVLIDAGARAVLGQSWHAPEFAAGAVATAVFFYLLLNVAESGEALAWGLVLASSVCCVAGLYWAWQGGYSELALTLGNRTHMAGLTILCAGPAIGLFLGARRSSFPRLVAMLASLLLIFSLGRTGSAAALLVLGGFAVLVGILTLGRRFPGWAVVFAVAACTLAGVWSTGTSYEPVARARRIVQGREDPTLSWDNRLRYWRGVAPALAARPVLGHGPGQVGDQYPRIRPQEPGLAPHGEILPDLHNTPLNWLFEYGSIGAALRIALFLGIVVAAVRAESPLQRWAGYSLAGYGAFSLFHYQLMNPAVSSAVVCVAAISVPLESSARLTPRGAFLIGLVLAGSAAAASGFWLRSDYAWFLFERSKTAEAAAAANDLASAANLDERGGLYDFFVALRLDRSPRPASLPPDLREGVRASAEHHFRRAATLQPFMPIVIAPYGRFLLRSNRPCESIDALETAVSLDYYFSMAHYDLANAYRLCGRSDMAESQCAIAILTQPALSFASAWQNPDRKFLHDCVALSISWLLAWEHSALEADDEAHTTLLHFLEKREQALTGDEAIAAEFTLSDAVGTDLPGDPFAFLFHRRSPYFVITEIPLSAPASGSWAPNGIGSIRGLSGVTFEQVREAYRRGRLDSFVRALGNSTPSAG